MSKIKSKHVKQLIEAKPKLGENDMMLYLVYISQYEDVKIEWDSQLVKDLIRLDSHGRVSRARRRVQEKHPELFSEEILDMREKRYVESLDEYGNRGINAKAKAKVAEDDRKEAKTPEYKIDRESGIVTEVYHG